MDKLVISRAFGAANKKPAVGFPAAGFFESIIVKTERNLFLAGLAATYSSKP